MTLSLALGMARDRAAGTDPDLESLLESAAKEAKEALVELRELARGIHPAVLTETGLKGALQSLIERSPVQTALGSVPDERYPPTVEATAYFVVSEALANVAKHAGARRASVNLSRSERTLVVEISDSGVGGARVDNGSGLRGLTDRLATVSGSLQIDSPPGEGTRIQGGDPMPMSSPPKPEPLRVLIAEDSVLLREGLERLLNEAGLEVAGTAVDAPQLLQLVEQLRPDVVLTDIRMPPTHTTEGLEAARKIRRTWPGTAVLVVSHHIETQNVVELLQDDPRGLGYVLKDGVADISQFTDAIRRVARGESVIDPEVVARLVARPRQDSPAQRLSDREREVLGLMAEGRSNQAIAERLWMSPKTVETHVSNIFVKLELLPAPEDHRRVLAVLAFLRA